jgi:putative transposase
MYQTRPNDPAASRKDGSGLETSPHHSFSKLTFLRWHCQGFKLSWRYTSRAAARKPKISAETVALIQEMARDNRLWGAERMRSELLKLGLRVCTRTIQTYMRQVRTARPRGQNWKTFVRTHAEQILGDWGL